MLEGEITMSGVEKSEKDSAKKKEMESMLKGMKDDYIRKMHSLSVTGGSNSSSSFVGI